MRSQRALQAYSPHSQKSWAAHGRSWTRLCGPLQTFAYNEYYITQNKVESMNRPLISTNWLEMSVFKLICFEETL